MDMTSSSFVHLLFFYVCIVQVVPSTCFQLACQLDRASTRSLMTGQVDYLTVQG